MKKKEQIDAVRIRYGLNDAIAGQIRQIGTKKIYPRGGRILNVGEPMDCLLFMLSGAVKQVKYLEDGTEIVNTLHYRPGDAVIPIEYDLFHTVDSGTEIVAIQQTEILCIPNEAIIGAMKESHEVMQLVFSVFNDYRRWYAEFHFFLSAFRSNLKGLLEYMIGSDPYIMANAGLEDMASFVGVSYYHLSRTRKELRMEKPDLFESLALYEI